MASATGVADEWRRYEIYVQTFPASGAKWQISNNGGNEPTWSHEGRELLYREGDMSEVGDGAVSVLKVEGVEKLLSLLVIDLFERFLHGQRRPRIFGHGIGLDFRVCAVNGEDVY